MAVRKPKRTDKVTLERVYRRLLALDHDMVNQLALIRLDQQSNRRDLEAKISSLAPIVSHCERLMREKVTLQRQLAEACAIGEADHSYNSVRQTRTEDWSKMVTREVNGPHAAHNCPCADSKCPGKQSYVDWKEKKAAAILNAAFCAFESTHRPGIRCNVCGHLEPKYGA